MKEIAPKISVDPRVRFGKPVITGTRVPVHLIVDKIAAGASPAEICREYGLKSAEIKAALNYASGIIKQESLMYIGG